MGARRRWVLRRLASERGPAFAILLGVLVSVPSMTVGFFNDDLLHRLALEEQVADFTPGAHALYDFVDGEERGDAMRARGYLPWFSEPDLRLRFFRPISSLLLALDHHAFGRSALAAHLHSLVWLLLVATFVGLLYRRVLRPATATVATAIYVLAGGHASTLGWLAARHTLVSATFAAGAIWAFVSWHQTGERWRGWLAPALLTLGLLASETALGAIPFLVLYAWIVMERPWGARIRASLPSILIGLAYLGFYALEGWGAHGSGTYRSPFDDPTGFAAALLLRIPPLLGELYGGVPVTFWALLEPARPIFWALGALAFGACAGLLYWQRETFRPPERRRALWLGLSSVVCLAPMVGTVLDGRLLSVALIGAAALLGTAFVQTFITTGRLSGPKRAAPRAMVIALALGAFALSPLVRLAAPLAMDSFADAEESLAETAELTACPDDGLAYLVTGADPTLSYYSGPAMWFHRPDEYRRLRALRVLSMAPHDQTLRGHEGGFTLEVDVDHRTGNLFERVYRVSDLPAGARVRAGELTATVEAADGPYPRVVRFDSDALDAVCLVRWDGDRLVAFPPPAPGETVAIPHVLGPMGL